MPSTGVFSNQFIEGMKQLYELQSFLDVRLLRPGKDLSRVREGVIGSDWDLKPGLCEKLLPQVILKIQIFSRSP